MEELQWTFNWELINLQRQRSFITLPTDGWFPKRNFNEMSFCPSNKSEKSLICEWGVKTGNKTTTTNWIRRDSGLPISENNIQDMFRERCIYRSYSSGTLEHVVFPPHTNESLQQNGSSHNLSYQPKTKQSINQHHDVTKNTKSHLVLWFQQEHRIHDLQEVEQKHPIHDLHRSCSIITNGWHRSNRSTSQGLNSISSQREIRQR